jgi:Cu(I)/Ag(I) efflux system membrane fusion protein
MTGIRRLSAPQAALAAVALLAAVGGGYGLAQLRMKPTSPPAQSAAHGGRQPLYWYDPMVPGQHFDKPGKSPYMDMQLVPKYADDGGAAAGVRIDPARVQSLGIRVVAAHRSVIANGLTATGVIDFNQRDVAIVQARAAGFVQRVYARAPGDVIRAGAPLADVLVPEWGGAQTEFLAVRRSGDPSLVQAARQRLALLGMPPGLIAEVERTGRTRSVVTITAPTGGVIRTLGVRAGMNVTAGQTLAEINGLGVVWLNAAVPEASAGQVRVGDTARATLAAFPGETFTGRVTAILPEAEGASRTLTVRIELPNGAARLRPGMFASVDLGGVGTPALLVPSEAVIRTGKRNLVMLALGDGHFRPAEVRVGRTQGNETEILAGLAEGEKVVASGQFLLDSEASLSGVEARPIGEGSMPMAGQTAQVATPALYETRGRIEQIGTGSVTLSHDPVPALGWPAMTMTFKLAPPSLGQGFKVGDQVRFAFDQPGGVATIRRMTKEAAR